MASGNSNIGSSQTSLNAVKNAANTPPTPNPGSRILALVILLLPVAGNLITWLSGRVKATAQIIIPDVIFCLGCLVFAVINFKNNSATDAWWKTWLGFAVGIVALLWPIYFLSQTYSG